MTHAARPAFDVQRTFAQAQRLGVRTLGLLQMIEETLDVVSLDTGLMNSVAAAHEELLTDLQRDPPRRAFDRNDELGEKLQTILGLLARLHVAEKERLASAEADTRLSDEDGIAEGYRSYLAAIERTHEAVAALAQWLDEHDAHYEEPSPGTFDSVEALVNCNN